MRAPTLLARACKKNATPHVGKEKILKLDIEGFFDHILYSTVKDVVFFKEKFSEPIRILLSMLCYHNDALPQGAPTSPAITNIIMRDFDEKVGEFCREKGVCYTRYCDDMTFSGDFDQAPIIEFVKDELKTLGLFLKNRKTFVIPKTKRQVVTGVVVNEKLNLTKDYTRKVRQEMHYIQKFGIDEHLKAIGEIDKQKYVNSLKGRIAYILQTIPGDKEFVEYKKAVSKL